MTSKRERPEGVHEQKENRENRQPKAGERLNWGAASTETKADTDGAGTGGMVEGEDLGGGPAGEGGSSGAAGEGRA